MGVGRVEEEALAKGLGLFRVGGLFRGPATHLVTADAERSGTQALQRTLRTSADEAGHGRALTGRTLTRDPIDVATGEVVLRQVDVELDGVLPMVIERTHLSSYTHGRLFGASWASTLDQHLEIDDEGVYLAGEDGMVLAFRVPSPGESVPPENGTLRFLSRTAEGRYTVTDRRTGRTWHFAASDPGVRRLPLSAVTDRNGNRIDLGYDEAGTLHELRHSGGYRIGVEVADGRVRSLRLRTEGPDGDIPLVRYGYDEIGRLTGVTDSSGESLHLSYDEQGRLTGWLDRNGNAYRYEYDEQGRGVRGIGSGGFLDATLSYDVARRITRVTDSLGHTTVYHLNDAGQVITEVDPLGRETRREWDRHDRPLAHTDPLGNTTRYHWDSAGNLAAVARPDGHRVTAAYNDLGLPVEVVEAGGAVRRYDYDGRGNLVALTDPLGAVTRYTFDRHGAVASVVDALGTTMRLRSNAAGLPVEVTEAGGATRRYERDAFGRVVTLTDPMGGRTLLRWTVEGRLTERMLPGGGVERWTYDAEGNEVEYADAAGKVTRTEYTNFDAPVARTTPEGGRLDFTLDTELRLVAVTNPTGMTWRYEYNAAGELVRETDFNDRALACAHDACGRLIERVNGAGQVTRYTRDVLGNVVRQRSGDQVTTFTRDLAGRVLRAVNADADLRFDRDAAGRITAETCNGRTLSSVYDVLGRRIGRRTPSGAVSGWSYDHASRPTALHAGGQVLRFGYDQAGREIRRHIGTGAVLDQQWDADDRLLAQTLWGAPVASSRTVTGRGPSVGAPGEARLLQHRAYAYRPDGNVTGIADRLSGERRFALDRAGRVTAVAHAQGWTERYAYDRAGNITRADRPETGTTIPPSLGDRAYDGTLIRRAGAVGYEHDGQGRLVRRSVRTLSGKRLTWHYEWNADDRLVAVTTPAGHRWRYRYDPLGRRIAKQRLADGGHALAEQVDFTWDGEVLAEQAHTTWRHDGPVRRVLTWNHRPGSHRPLTQVERAPLRDAPQEWVDREFRAIVTDLTGSATEMVDLAGSVTWRPVTDLWGAPLDGAGREDACPLRFPGQYHDPETGLNYNYFRYYDPDTARYQAPDPLGLAPQPNPHAYTHNPIIRIDPLGLSPYKVGDVDSMVDNMNEDTWFHYTDEDGLKSIMGNGDEAKFVANSRGKVFFTQDMLSPSEVETNIFIGNPLYAGKGEHMIAFQRPEGAVFVPGEQPNEVIHWGSIRIPRSQILYSGKNPF
ncbi:DUF6531 domain-containing protein [Actinoallomurus acaciae]|uniref:DUF6531 domain-containing protein n=1 Tax=Actinoallomurus acaciae TaxID=502577 RepID=A0ABV5YEG1_9ACTN